jgi:hypothetical protein
VKGVVLAREGDGKGLALVREGDGKGLALVREGDGKGLALVREHGGKGSWPATEYNEEEDGLEEDDGQVGVMDGVVSSSI